MELSGKKEQGRDKVVFLYNTHGCLPEKSRKKKRVLVLTAQNSEIC